MDKVTLKSCPFCGGKALCQAHRIAEDAEVAFVNCTSCGVQTEHFEDVYAPRGQAIDSWNTRSDFLAGVKAMQKVAAKVVEEWPGLVLTNEPALFRDGSRWTAIHTSTAIRSIDPSSIGETG